MATQRRIASPASAVLAGIALVLLNAGCGQATSSTQTQSAEPNSPPGGPVPAAIQGDWFLPPATVSSIMSNDSCRLLKLTLAATTYHLTHSINPACGTSSSGDVVVNKAEIDFFSADVCGLKLPDGVGRYTWTLTGGVLHFAAMKPDPCPRGTYWLDHRDYSRTG